MALESLIGDIYRTNQQTPLGYGDLYNKQFSPYYAFLAQQAQGLGSNQGNVGQAGISGATSLGNSALGLYGNLSNLRQEQQQFNSLAPVLGSLLNQFGGGGGFSLPAISPIADPMAGYQSAIGGAYQQLGNAQNRAYDENRSAADAFSGQFGDVFNRQAGMMPKLPGGIPGQGPGLFDMPSGSGSQNPNMHGGYMTGGGLQPPPDVMNGGGNYPVAMPGPASNPFAAPQGGGWQPNPNMPILLAPGSSGPNAPAAQGWYGQTTPYGTNPGYDDVVQSEMNRLRAGYTGGPAPQGVSYWSQDPGAGGGQWKQKIARPDLKQQDEARRRLGLQMQQEAEMAKLAQPMQANRTQTAPAGGDQQQYTFGGSTSTYMGPNTPNKVTYRYNPVVPTSIYGTPPKAFPGQVQVTQN